MTDGRIAVVGSLNCDLVMNAPRRPATGETLLGTSFHVFVGGKGCNQAIAAARAGAAVSMVGRIGSDAFGDMVLAKLDATSIERKFVARDVEARTGVADILVDANGDNSIVVAPEANARVSTTDVDLSREAMTEAAVVLLELEIPLATVKHAVKLARALGKIVVLNPAPAPTDPRALDDLLSDVDVLVPNHIEAAALAGVRVDDIATAREACRALRARGARAVIVTLGERGAVLASDEHDSVHLAPFAVAVVDTTAAGDAFCGALAASLSRGLDLCVAARFACAAGALACTKLGAEPSLPFRDAIEALTRGEAS